MSDVLRKVCVVITNRASYARVKYLLQALKDHPRIDLQLIVSASALLHRYGKVLDIIKNDGFSVDRVVHYVVDGENLVAQAKSIALGISELSSVFLDMNPDVVITVADRYETMATAIAASYLNIPLAHVQGGEVSGNIDDSVRHAITKLAHLHYPSTKKSMERIIKMGEEPWRVKCTGCPSIDILRHSSMSLPNKGYFENSGTGVVFDPDKEYVMIVQHPVTTSFGDGAAQITNTLNAIRYLDMQVVILWPNPDAGSSDIAKELRKLQNQNCRRKISFHINFTPEVYAALLANARCLIGNSSSFIREGSYLGVPAVIVGDRQEGRECANNVVFSNYDSEEIKEKIISQMRKGSYQSSNIFGDGFAGVKIAEDIANNDLVIKKKFTY